MYVKQLFPAFSNYTSLVFKNIRSNTLKSREAPNLELVRYAARKGTRAAVLAAKKARKLKDSNKPEPIPKYLQRKIKVSAELERRRCTDENWLETEPIDNVYNMKLYRGKPYSVAEAVEMHRETHQPEMLNNPSALIYANIELDLKTKKKDRYMEDFAGQFIFSHTFVGEKKNRIIVLCKNEEDQMQGTEAGAAFAGSAALVKQILSGAVARDEFDYLICHPDMLKEVNVLRGIMGKKFPNTYNGLLRLDIGPAVTSFTNAVEYKMKRSALEPDFGWVDACFGRLDMPIEQLEENLTYALKNVEKFKPGGTTDILFVVRTRLWCEKSREKFKIPHWKYLPDYPENGVIVEEDTENVGEEENVDVKS